jgi:predicted 2-oxoglutarate/Fe(II)-dependent dioxygenase YbiX
VKLQNELPKYRSSWSTGTMKFLRGDAPPDEMHLDWLRAAEPLSPHDCDNIVRACMAFPSTVARSVGDDKFPAHQRARRAETRKIGLDDSTQWLFDMLCDAAEQANGAGLGLTLSQMSRAPQFVEYRPGWGQFDWHNDYSHGLPDAPRKLTIIIQLSDENDYEGGALEVFGAEIQALPRCRGTVVAFPSFLFHRVTPVTSGIRRALVAWIGGPQIV